MTTLTFDLINLQDALTAVTPHLATKRERAEVLKHVRITFDAEAGVTALYATDRYTAVRYRMPTGEVTRKAGRSGGHHTYTIPATSDEDVDMSLPSEIVSYITKLRRPAAFDNTPRLVRLTVDGVTATVQVQGHFRPEPDSEMQFQLEDYGPYPPIDRFFVPEDELTDLPTPLAIRPAHLGRFAKYADKVLDGDPMVICGTPGAGGIGWVRVKLGNLEGVVQPAKLKPQAGR